jgi:hypothetical protein
LHWTVDNATVVRTSNDYDRWHQHEKSDEGFHYFMAPFYYGNETKGIRQRPRAPNAP